MKMCRTTLLLACLFWPVAFSTACDSSPPDALEILKKANAAVAKLNSISYQAKFYAEGSLAAKVPAMEGKVTAKRDPSGSNPHFRIDGSVAIGDPKAQVVSTLFNLAFDGRSLYNIEQASQTFTSGPLEAGMAVNNPLFQPKYLHASPFDEEIKIGNLQYQGEEAVDGVPCTVISFKNSGAESHVTKLFLGKQDYLLRRTETAMPASAARGGNPASDGRVVFTVSGLTANPEAKDELFRLDCPPGFRQQAIKSPRSEPQPGQTALLSVGSQAPDWDLKTVDGKTVDLKSLRGKVILLDFWATWCGPCKMSMPGMQKLHDRFKDKPVAILGVNCRERTGAAGAVAYVKEKAYTYGQLFNGDAVADAYRVNGLPCVYVIGPDGKVVFATSGYNPALEQIIADVIQNALPK